MCKTPKQIVDDFFFEYGGIEPDPVPDEFDRFKNLNLDELNELASFGIGLRIGLRSSGHIKDDLIGSFVHEQQNLFRLSVQQLKETIDQHSKAYKAERPNH